MSSAKMATILTRRGGVGCGEFNDINGQEAQIISEKKMTEWIIMQ